jgi:hypothetical protein
MVDLCVFLTDKEKLTYEVVNLCDNLPTNIAKLKYLRGLLKKFKSEPGMFIHFVVSVIFANNTEYLLILVLFFPTSYRQIRESW